MNYTVKTQDVDGRGSKRFKSLAGARKRFEEMVGYTMENAIAEHYHPIVEAGGKLPTVEEIKRLRGVSMFGTVVIFEAKESS